MVAGFFVSKGILNIGFYLSCILAMLLILQFPGNRAIQSHLRTFAAPLCLISLLALLESISWKQSPFENLLTDDMIHKEWKLGLYFLAPILISLLVKQLTTIQRIWIFKTAVIGLAVLGFLGCSQWFLSELGLSQLKTSTEDRHVTGLQPLALFFGYQCYPWVVLLSSLLIERDGPLYSAPISRSWRMTVLVAVVLGFVAILGSGNRVSAFCIFLSWPILFLRQKPKKLLPFIGLMFLVLGTVIYRSPVGDRVQMLGHEEGSQIRPVLWRAHGRAWLDRPFLGFGRHINSIVAVNHFTDEKGKLGEYTWYNAHNLFLDLLSSLGALGLLLFLSFALWFPWRAIQSRPLKYGEKKTSSPLLFSVCVTYGAWMIGALFESALDASHARMNFIFLVTALAFLIVPRNHPDRSRTQ